MTDINEFDEALARVGENLARSNRVARFRTLVKEHLEEIVTSLLQQAGVIGPGLVNVMLLLIFTYIDLLGYLYKGRSSSCHAVEFMREYLGRVDERYREVSGLLYDALRHGSVHLATPKRIELQNAVILDFSFGPRGQRQDHLKVVKTQEIQEGIDIYRLSLILSLFYEDLISAMDMYADDIRDNQALSDIFWKAFETRREPRKATEAQLLKEKSSYIQDSDFAFVRKQISHL